MSEPVKKKKPYVSALRDAQARSTRRAIVAAATALFVERGYGGTTIDAIAEGAGVSRKTVFSSLGGKSEALKLALDWSIVGDDEPVPVLERPQVQVARAEPDARKIVRMYAEFFCSIAARVAPVVAVVRSAAGIDGDVRALHDVYTQQRLVGMTHFAGELDSRGALRPDLTLTEAADVLWSLTDPGTYQRLVNDRGWKVERFQAWMADALIHLLIDPSYRPPRAKKKPVGSR